MKLQGTENKLETVNQESEFKNLKINSRYDLRSSIGEEESMSEQNKMENTQATFNITNNLDETCKTPS